MKRIAWEVQIGTAGGALTTYARALPEFFINRLNAIGYFSLLLPTLGGNSKPTREQLVRITWNDGATPRTHFEGYITDVRQLQGKNAYRIRGLSLDALLWQSTIGSLRTYSASVGSMTPYDLMTRAVAPLGLMYNGQGNLRPIGGTTLQYGSSASVPNKVEAANPGTSLSFLADSNKNLLNIQRLALQARYDGTSYGLEFFAQLEGANNSDPRFYLVKRRARAAAYTAETFTIDGNLFNARRGTEGLTATEAVRVVGSGDGQNRIESGLVGSGGLEGIVADKSILNATNAANMANRLNELLNPSTEMVTGWTSKHNFATKVGDNVDIAESGVATATLRVFEIGYDLRRRGFFFAIGRPRPLHEDPFYKMDALAGSQAHAPQPTDSKRITATAVLNTQPSSTGVSTIAANSSIVTTLNFTDRTFTPADDNGIQFHIQVGCYNTGTTNGRRTPIDIVLEFGGGTRIIEMGATTASGGVNILGRWEASYYYSAQFMVDVIGAGGTLNSAVLTAINRDSVDVDMIVQLSAHVVPAFTINDG